MRKNVADNKINTTTDTPSDCHWTFLDYSDFDLTDYWITKVETD